MSSYSEKLKDPRWQKKRLQILERDHWKCSACGTDNQTLYVHHAFYTYDAEPWDYPEDSLHSLCEECHQEYDDQRKHIQRRIGCLPFDVVHPLSAFLDVFAGIDNGNQVLLLETLFDLANRWRADIQDVHDWCARESQELEVNQ